ncbi:hypothetical protein DCS_06468 [Drechmeria coniospora]|uniref:Zinc finger PHD-type domain-containing protein n=1 Tax=Drechmeria coniospora TaxID=98403 RepID=A0A151GBM2_DRECN|nr:hypothetical protein DCS_06468 [Drechmeria coniospora]KYK54510.1 hypothetical protein DCS_06468 [Drechmeria coniospora]
MSSRTRSSQASDDKTDAKIDCDAGTNLLCRIRNMWQFANFCQWVYIFGRAANIDDSVDVEHIEAECLNPHSTLLPDLALAVLKLVSSQRGLTRDVLDDQMRKMYTSKAPKERNPFGNEDNAHKFADFDVFTKIQVLQRLTQWAMIRPERLREKMDEQRDVEQASWRIEPYGWDKEDRTYYVLDDNRVYRLSEPPQAPPRTKSKKGKAFRARQQSGARRMANSADHRVEGGGKVEPVDDGLGGHVWECIAVTLQDVRRVLESLSRTRDGNETTLRKQLEMHLVPILEKQEESQKRHQLQRERELLNLAKMANAKRSSRLAGKAELQKQKVMDMEAERQKREAEETKRKEEAERLKLERARDFRMFSRQRRLQERETRRLQHEEELAQLSADSKNAHTTAGRMSERRLQAEMQKSRQALQDLEDDCEDWVFDCTCGLYGQIDDGTHSVACERCNVWQHSRCLGISKDEAERPEFRFICSPCKRRGEADFAPPRTVIKLKLNPSGRSVTNPTPAGHTDVSPVILGPEDRFNTMEPLVRSPVSTGRDPSMPMMGQPTPPQPPSAHDGITTLHHLSIIGMAHTAGGSHFQPTTVGRAVTQNEAIRIQPTQSPCLDSVHDRAAIAELGVSRTSTPANPAAATDSKQLARNVDPSIIDVTAPSTMDRQLILEVSNTSHEPAYGEKSSARDSNTVHNLNILTENAAGAGGA